MLKAQVARARALGFDAMMATELEFYLFENSYENLRDGGLRGLKPVSAYNEDYHIFQTTKEEDVMRAVRNGLYAVRAFRLKTPKERRTRGKRRSTTATPTRWTRPTTT